jgi:DNA-binding CsgD family transcriptional regulator
MADGRSLLVVASDPRLELAQSGARLVALRAQHPVLARWEGTGDMTPMAISELVDRQAFDMTQLARDMLELGIVDQLVIPIPRCGSTIAVGINRSGWGFTAKERRLAARLQTVLSLSIGYRRHEDIAQSAQRRLCALAAEHGAVVLLCDRCGRVLRADGSSTAVEPLIEAAVAQAASAAFATADGNEPDSIFTELTIADHGGDPTKVRVFAPAPGESFVAAVVTAPRRRVDREALERHGLTGRQVDTMLMILNGATNGSVANELGISERTVEKHVLAAYQRLGARTRTEALLAILQ